MSVKAGNQDKNMGQSGCPLCGINYKLVNWEEHAAGKKHQFNLKRETAREKERNGVFITGFPMGMPSSHIEGMCKTYGTITDFFHKPDKNFVLVSFKEKESADSLISAGVIVGNRKLIVRRRRMLPQLTSPSKDSPEGETSLPKVNHGHVEETLKSGCSLDDFVREIEVPPKEKAKYKELIRDLERVFETRFKKCQAHVFGSTRTGLCMKGSDIDVFVEITQPEESLSDISSLSLPEKLVRVSQKMLLHSGGKFNYVRAITHAKMPIVKCVHGRTGISCDISFKNSLGVANSELIKHYITLDHRVYPFFMVIKYWAHRHGFSGCGKLTNYALVTLAAFYLQQLDPPVLPTVQQLQELCDQEVRVDSWLCSFNLDPKAIEPSKNTSSVVELLAGFFNFYHNLKVCELVICPLLGITIPKDCFINTDLLPEPLRTAYATRPERRDLAVITDMCVQDPFELVHNVTASMGSKSLSLFQSCIRLAVDIFEDILKVPEQQLSTLLNKLFTSQPNDLSKNYFTLTPDEMHLTILANGNLSVGLVTSDSTSGSDKWSVTQKWFMLMHEVVVDILKNVMKFEVHTGDPPSKVMKIDTPSDVHLHEKPVITGKGYYAMWENRNKMHKSMGGAVYPHRLAAETAISDALLDAMQKDQPQPSEPLIEISCEFENIDNPTGIRLHLKDIGSKKVHFNRCMEFIKGKVPTIVEKYLKYLKHKVHREHKLGHVEESAVESADV